MKRAITALLIVLASLLVPPAPAQAAPGWKLLWSSDFNGNDIPDICARYGGSYDIGDSYWDSQHATVSGGLLRLGIERKPKGDKHYASGGITCYQREQKYGKFEWRAKVPPGKGIDSYATLWPERDLPNQAALIEILGTPPGHEDLSITNEYGSGKTGGDVYGSYTDGFHTYTIEWSPTRFRLLVDGVQKYTSNRVCTVKRSIGFAVSNGDNFTGVPDGATPLPAEFQIDWVRAYSYVAAAPVPASTVRATSPAAHPTTPGASTPVASVTAGAIPSDDASQPALSNAAQPGASSGWGWWALAALALLLGGAALRTVRRGRRSGRGSTVE